MRCEGSARPTRRPARSLASENESQQVHARVGPELLQKLALVVLHRSRRDAKARSDVLECSAHQEMSHHLALPLGEVRSLRYLLELGVVDRVERPFGHRLDAHAGSYRIEPSRGDQLVAPALGRGLTSPGGYARATIT